MFSTTPFSSSLIQSLLNPLPHLNPLKFYLHHHLLGSGDIRLFTCPPSVLSSPGEGTLASFVGTIPTSPWTHVAWVLFPLHQLQSNRVTRPGQWEQHNFPDHSDWSGARKVTWLEKNETRGRGRECSVKPKFSVSSAEARGTDPHPFCRWRGVRRRCM